VSPHDPADRYQRFVPEPRSDYRSAAQVDRDRILYSTAFLRLAEVTQVVSPDRGYVFHNRLTHSLKVAQLARRLAEKLQKAQSSEASALGLDADVAEAAALAHDLGHPPFGHIAEDELDRLARNAGLSDGFNGNAQSFRIAARLAMGDAVDRDNQPMRGLNLTCATLNAILKYPWLYGENESEPDKWGAYESERDVFEWVRAARPTGSQQRCAEAELMDWADDITYAVHDLVDFYRAGQIPLDLLADNVSEQTLFFDSVFERRPKLDSRRRELEDLFSGIVEFFPVGRRYDGSFEQRCTLWQGSTVVISKWVDAITLCDASSERFVSFEPNAKDEVLMLKELTWRYVILNKELATLQHGQRRTVRTVFLTMLRTALDRKKWSLFPVEYQEELNAAAGDRKKVTRIVTDFVASMTEKEITSLCRSLCGSS
jgi:dGTPase